MATDSVEPAIVRGSDFDPVGIVRGPDDIARYVSRPPTLVAMLRASVERAGSADAVIEVDGPRLTYQQLWDGAATVAGGLRSRGVRPGDRVALRLPAGAEWCVAFLTSLFVGAAAVPLNTRLTAAELDELQADADVAVTIGPGETRALAGRPFVFDGAEPDDMAAIFYTSGTAGRPKGVIMSHANILANIESALRAQTIGDGADWRTLICVPLFHVTGCNSQLLPAWERGGTAVILPRFDVATYLRVARRGRISLLGGVPRCSVLSWTPLSARAPSRSTGSSSARCSTAERRWRRHLPTAYARRSLLLGSARAMASPKARRSARTCSMMIRATRCPWTVVAALAVRYRWSTQLSRR